MKWGERSAEKLLPSLTATEGHIDRFLQQLPHPGFGVERVAIAPEVPGSIASRLKARDWLVEDLSTLTAGL